MTLPWRMDDFAWPFVLPILGGMVWVYTRQPNHPIKLLLLGYVTPKVELWDRLRKAGIVIYWCAFLLLSIGCALSFLLWAGVLTNPPGPYDEKLKKMNTNEFELVTEGYSIDARPKPTTAEATSVPAIGIDGR